MKGIFRRKKKKEAYGVNYDKATGIYAFRSLIRNMSWPGLILDLWPGCSCQSDDHPLTSLTSAWSPVQFSQATFCSRGFSFSSLQVTPLSSSRHFLLLRSPLARASYHPVFFSFFSFQYSFYFFYDRNHSVPFFQLLHTILSLSLSSTPCLRSFLIHSRGNIYDINNLYI